jgi:hypothetical protein
MGMDVYGNNPISERGEYFRNNVWWWRPLWDFCQEVAPELVSDVQGHTNDGDGLDEEGAKALANILTISLAEGVVDTYEVKRKEYLASLPKEDCNLCDSTGIRTDDIGKEHGMDIQVLSDAEASALGRTIGYCNGCSGNGWKDSWETHYPFEKANVQEFAEFLADSGGFKIC